MQVPIEVPEDFSVILEKGKGSGVRVRQPGDGREGEDCRARKERRATNFNETHPGETQDQSRARKGYQDRRGGKNRANQLRETVGG